MVFKVLSKLVIIGNKLYEKEEEDERRREVKR
jgi:hypothetical protein